MNSLVLCSLLFVLLCSYLFRVSCRIRFTTGDVFSYQIMHFSSQGCPSDSVFHSHSCNHDAEKMPSSLLSSHHSRNLKVKGRQLCLV
ncbi:hypothetical protein BDU57DRAFT_323673 [Ampelomyces quisqualis]|uniref:Secreted protein n=1 Tax=Ampelomyces quisqualis TaxID=50730 RepID=A0A6A5QDX2_AMPQU|nr:hypothetical protein BDU57DRAFT_323673 [Ampelomyces quisqualis]